MFFSEILTIVILIVLLKEIKSKNYPMLILSAVINIIYLILYYKDMSFYFGAMLEG
jgi:hypothetical protein